MTVTLDEATEQILQRELDRRAFASADAAIACAVRLLAQQDEDDWLLRNRGAISAALKESFAAKERGDSFSPEEAEVILSDRRAARVRHAA